jgi:hypothetical protein
MPLNTYQRNSCGNFGTTGRPYHHFRITVPVHQYTGTHRRQRPLPRLQRVVRRTGQIKIIPEVRKRKVVHHAVQDNSGLFGRQTGSKAATFNNIIVKNTEEYYEKKNMFCRSDRKK